MKRTLLLTSAAVALTLGLTPALAQDHTDSKMKRDPAATEQRDQNVNRKAEKAAPEHNDRRNAATNDRAGARSTTGQASPDSKAASDKPAATDTKAGRPASDKATKADADKSSAQVRVAHADLLAHSAELNLRDAARTLSRMGEAGPPPDDFQRVRVMAQCAHASSLAQQAANLILQGAGASIHALSNPMQRLVRDVNVACSHQLHEFDELAEPYGRMLFGLPPEPTPT